MKIRYFLPAIVGHFCNKVNVCIEIITQRLAHNKKNAIKKWQREIETHYELHL